METKENILEPLLERAEEYGKTSFELLKLKSVDKVSDVASTAISRLVLFFALSFFLFSVNTAVALWLGDLLGKSYYGFFIIGFFYALVGMVLFFIQPSLKAKINNSIIEKVLN
jgi:pilus assembly protein TadC